MKILVAVASRHGSTHEIADALALELGTAGHDVDVQPIEDSPTVEGTVTSEIGRLSMSGLTRSRKRSRRRARQLTETT